MEFFPTNDEFLVPYLDGDERCVAIGMGYLEIDPHGDYECDRTDGSPESPNRCSCDECGETHNEDEMHWVEGSDINVCESCLNDEFTYVIGRRGNEYYVRNDYAVYVESQDQHYDEDYLDHNNIVRTVDDEYEHTDELVHIESDDEWYPQDDDRIVYDDYNERYELLDNCEETEDNGWVLESDTWVCETTGKRYSRAIDPVIIDDLVYHPDHVPETNDEPNEE